MRTLLTILGIVIGIAAVIALTSLIDGMRAAIVGQLGLNAARTVEIDVLAAEQPTAHRGRRRDHGPRPRRRLRLHNLLRQRLVERVEPDLLIRGDDDR